MRAFYYTTMIEDHEFCSLRPLIDWLDYNGYTVVTKTTKEFIKPADELRRQADVFTDLVESKSKFGRDPTERPALRLAQDQAPVRIC